MVLICAFVSCQYAVFLVLFLYMISTLYCALRREKYIGKLKISTVYAFKWQRQVVRRFLFSLLVKYFDFEEIYFPGPTEISIIFWLLKTGFYFILFCQSFCAICRLIIFSGKSFFFSGNKHVEPYGLLPPFTKHTQMHQMCSTRANWARCLVRNVKVCISYWYRINQVLL